MADVGSAGILVEDTFCGPMKELPAEGMLLAIDEMPVKLGGCAANVAIGLTRQGISVDVVGTLGNDASSKVLLSSFEEQGVSTDQINYTDDFPTSKTVILLVEGEDRRFIHVFGANKAFTISQIDRDWVAGLNVFYLGGLFAMPSIDIAELADLLQFCRQNNVATVVDVVVPGKVPMDAVAPILPHTDWFTPNDDEAFLFTGSRDPNEQLRIFRDHGANTVVITQGKDGAVAARGDEVWRCGTFSMEPVDPTGSGDAFTNGIIAAILRGLDLPDTLTYASAIGASCTQAVGTTDGVFTAEEAEAFIQANPLELSEVNR